MADYTIAAGEIASHAHTLSPGAEDTVTFPEADRKVTLILHPDGADPVYVTIGAAAATVAGAHCRILFPGSQGQLFGPDGILNGLEGARTDVTKVRLISDGAVTYSVET